MKHSNIKKNVINSKSLSFRENFNKKYQKNNFDDWVLKNYKFKKNMEILDIGCGNGKQIIQAIKVIKKSGRVVGIDLSKNSINKLNIFRNKKKIKNLKLVNGSMDDIEIFYKKGKIDGKFDLIHSTYAFYYSRNFIKILKYLKNKLNKNGKFIITFPGGKNSLKSEYLGENNKKILSTLKYNPNSLVKVFKKNFNKVYKRKFINKLVVNNYNDLIKFTRSAGFYNKSKEITFAHKAKKKLLQNKSYNIYKDSIMIIGKNEK